MSTDTPTVARAQNFLVEQFRALNWVNIAQELEESS